MPTFRPGDRVRLVGLIPDISPDEQARVAGQDGTIDSTEVRSWESYFPVRKTGPAMRVRFGDSGPAWWCYVDTLELELSEIEQEILSS